MGGVVISSTGAVTLINAKVDDIEAEAGGTVTMRGSRARDISMAAPSTNFGNIAMVDSEARDLYVDSYDGLFNYVHLSKTRITRHLEITNSYRVDAEALWVDPSGTAGAAVEITSCNIVRLGGTIEAAGGESVIFTDVEDGELDMLIMASPSSDNAVDAVSLAGACARIRLAGSIRGGTDPDRTANNPRYAIAVGASCTDIDIYTAISGAQTGDINDLTSGEVTVH